MRELFESTVERLLADLSTPEAVLACEGGEGGSWPAALWEAVEESGFALAAAPEAHGGAGAGWDDLYVVLTACGRHARRRCRCQRRCLPTGCLAARDSTRSAGRCRSRPMRR